VTIDCGQDAPGPMRGLFDGGFVTTHLAVAAALGVTRRVSVVTGDMTALPFPDDRIDIVRSAWELRDVSDPGLRKQAKNEMLRVLTMWMRTGGTPSSATTSRRSVVAGRTVARILPQPWAALTSV
jgi:ubiquinone/menaquinone biosynthesis C-methylase UbiE